jgi:hypothetical protein
MLCSKNCGVCSESTTHPLVEEQTQFQMNLERTEILSRVLMRPETKNNLAVKVQQQFTAMLC